MYRDQLETEFKSQRSHGRKEWDRNDEDAHQLRAREHSRQPAKGIRTHGIREAEAERQIRELRARY
jgi:hypothetical protein